MRKIPLIAVLFMASAFTTSALAAGYGSAGCGLGGMLIKENKKLHQIGAWILNGISGNQTFGMTTGTSGCGDSMMSQSEHEQKMFVENNYDSLAKEMAAGQGESVAALAGLLGCPAQPFSGYVQANYVSIFPSERTTPAEMLDAVKRGLIGEPALAASCHRI
jgi:hypothetical protein